MNRSMLTLDLDFAAQDMTDILSMFYDFAIVSIQHISTENSPRLRLVIPLNVMSMQMSMKRLVVKSQIWLEWNTLMIQPINHTV